MYFFQFYFPVFIHIPMPTNLLNFHLCFPRCPNCGSDLVLETEAAPAAAGDEEEEGVSLGIPACEMLDLAVMIHLNPTLLIARDMSMKMLPVIVILMLVTK